MQRRRFFFFERLAIPRRERIAVIVLLVTVLFFSAGLYFLQQKVYYNKEYYRDLERVFQDRTRQLTAGQEKALTADSQPSRSAKFGRGVLQSVSDGSIAPDSLEDGERIDINQANRNLLQELPGVGPAYAQRIVSWRERNGPFRSPDQLMEVDGIGPVRMEAIRPLVKVSPTEPDSLLHDSKEKQ